MDALLLGVVEEQQGDGIPRVSIEEVLKIVQKEKLPRATGGREERGGE